jgi:hypothetical protein
MTTPVYLTDRDRANLRQSIAQSMDSWKGNEKERHYLLEMLGFASVQTYKAQDAATVKMLILQVQLLSQELAAMQKQQAGA